MNWSINEELSTISLDLDFWQETINCFYCNVCLKVNKLYKDDRIPRKDDIVKCEHCGARMRAVQTLENYNERKTANHFKGQ